ncbi:hypothetical protein LIER_34643 [Lithospermum erythrorhizon]|uniref:Uncharacterized protein n=1 Tax=Lithospermum erythrorhizon TaxID=34254 RepID=A0AAV3S332_LITER
MIPSRASEKCRKSRSCPVLAPWTRSPSPSVVWTPSKLASMIGLLPPKPSPSSGPSVNSPVDRRGRRTRWPPHKKTKCSYRIGEPPLGGQRTANGRVLKKIIDERYRRWRRIYLISQSGDGRDHLFVIWVRKRSLSC